MKGSNDASAPGTKAGVPQPTNARRSPLSRPIEGFTLSGVSSLPDPRTNAYRKDLADAALAGMVIASHYAEPLVRHVIAGAKLLPEPDNDAEPLAKLSPGDEIRMLDMSLGWAWGYGPDGRVGYIRAEAIGA